jgi:alpha-L-glutamate ligase-like protein
MVMKWIKKIRQLPILGINRRNIELISGRNERRYYTIADDKLLTKALLSKADVPVSPTLATFGSFFDVRHFDEKIGDLEEFVIKSARGSGGRGILVICERNDHGFITPANNFYTKEMMIKHICDIVFGVFALDKEDVAIVEPRLKPTPFFSSLCSKGLTDVRVIVADETACLAMLRVPTTKSDGKANLHQGAIGVGVDIHTGKTYRAWQNGGVIETHSETGMPLIGETVDAWPSVIEVATRAAKALPLKYLGLDVVVDVERGPLVLEVNVRPGIEIQNVTGVSLLTRLQEKGVLSPSPRE